MKELIEIRRIAMELLGLNLQDEAVNKVYEIRNICDKTLEKQKDEALYEEARAAISHLFGSY